MDHWFNGKPDKSRGGIGEVKYETNIEPTLVSASDIAWQATIRLGS